MNERIIHLPVIAAALTAAVLTVPVVALASAPDESVVPSRMCGPYFYIPIEVDGPDDGSRVTLNALFDTGGAQLSIDPQTVERILGRKVEHGDPVRLRNATAGPMSFGALKPRAWSMEHLSRLIGMEIDLFLPFRAFRDVLLTLDFPRREIRVGKGRLPSPDGVEVFDARGRDRRPYLSITIGGRERRLLADSGSSGSISIREDGPLRWASGPSPLRVAQTMESVTFQEIGRLDEEIDIAGVPIPAPIVTLTEGQELIGTDVMSRFAWTFDQRSRRMRIHPSSREALELEGVRGTGAITKPADTGLEIVRVLPETPADVAGLLAGDVVVAVNGTPVYEQGCERWDEREQDDDTALTVRRGARSFDVSLSRVVLVP